MKKIKKSGLLKMVRRYVAGTATEEERIFLEAYYSHFESREDIFNSLPEEKKLKLENEMHELLNNSIDNNLRSLRPIWLSNSAIAAAASIILVAAFFLYFQQKNLVEKPSLFIKTKPVIKDISPGGNKAILILADGSKITLDDKVNGEIAQQNGISINNRKDGQLTYTITKTEENNKNLYNTIKTPKGGEYRINLPDGTRIWLNAVSSLRFPTAFEGKVREVELDGEAYFEVAPNKHMPFIIKSNRQLVEVLGTHFNVNSYADETIARTTLLEGSVKISIPNGKYSQLLKPGQQSTINSVSQPITVKEIDTEEAVAWKNGYFIFANENIYSIMRKLSRWYNIDVEYKGNVTDARFGGNISKTKNISEVLRILELTKVIHFKIEGRRVIVMT